MFPEILLRRLQWSTKAMPAGKSLNSNLRVCVLMVEGHDYDKDIASIPAVSCCRWLAEEIERGRREIVISDWKTWYFTHLEIWREAAAVRQLALGVKV